MALTIANQYKWAWGSSEFFIISKVTADASYPSGGYPLTASQFTLNTFASTSDAQLQTPSPFAVGVWADGSSGALAGAYAEIDNTNGNLRLFAAAGTEFSGVGANGVVTALCMFGH